MGMTEMEEFNERRRLYKKARRAASGARWRRADYGVNTAAPGFADEDYLEDEEENARNEYVSFVKAMILARMK